MNEATRLLFQELADLSPLEREKIYRDRGIALTVRAEVESLIDFDRSDECREYHRSALGGVCIRLRRGHYGDVTGSIVSQQRGPHGGRV